MYFVMKEREKKFTKKKNFSTPQADELEDLKVSFTDISGGEK